MNSKANNGKALNAIKTNDKPDDDASKSAGRCVFFAGAAGLSYLAASPVAIPVSAAAWTTFGTTIGALNLAAACRKYHEKKQNNKQ